MKLMSIINEMVTKEKILIGRGAFHSIYPSVNNPNIVYKVGYGADRMNSWVELFNEHPDLFPKTYGVIKTFKFDVEKGIDGSVIKQKTGYYIAVEKLNTKSFFRFWNQIDELCIDKKFHHYLRYFDYGDMHNLGKRVKNIKPELLDQFIDFVNLVDTIYEIKPSADLHVDQFGIDKDGKIKCLDV